MTTGVRACVGDKRLHQVLNLVDALSMRCNCYVSFNYHQKRP